MEPYPQLEKWLQKFHSHGLRWGNGLAKHCLPVDVETKPGANPVKVCQYPMPLEASKGITPQIRRLLDLGVLRPV